MKKFKLLIAFFLLTIYSYSQKQSVFDTSFANTSSMHFFINNPVIDSIVVENNGYFVYLKTKWESTISYKGGFRSYDYYRFSFIGDVYLFEKKYGKLQLPEKETVSLDTRGCSKWCTPKISLSTDSIKYRLKCNCPSNEPSDDYEFVFTKTETLARIKNGTFNLQKQIQNAFSKAQNHIKIAPTDSVLIYKVWVYPKDSCLQQIELSEGSFSPFEKMVMEVLKQTCLWLPAEQGGRPVSYISKVFVRLKDDNSIVVDIMK